MLELANRFGLHTVAEGVETADQLAALRRLGCDSAQGYHLGRPLPPEDIPALFVRPRSHGAARPPASTPPTPAAAGTPTRRR